MGLAFRHIDPLGLRRSAAEDARLLRVTNEHDGFLRSAREQKNRIDRIARRLHSDKIRFNGNVRRPDFISYDIQRLQCEDLVGGFRAAGGFVLIGDRSAWIRAEIEAPS